MIENGASELIPYEFHYHWLMDSLKTVILDEFKNNLLNAISICNIELANRKNGINGESTVEQLEEIIIPELNQILCMINSNQLPAKEERYLNSFANAFKVWGWNMQTPSDIFIFLVQLNSAYKNL